MQALRKNLAVTGSEPSGAGIKADEAGLRPQRSLRVELVIFLALLAAFAGVLFKDAIVERHFRLDRYTIAGFKIYPYADNLSGGRSTINVSPGNPLAWRCDLRRGWAYPYCGYGIMLDVARRDVGRPHEPEDDERHVGAHACASDPAVVTQIGQGARPACTWVASSA